MENLNLSNSRPLKFLEEWRFWSKSIFRPQAFVPIALAMLSMYVSYKYKATSEFRVILELFTILFIGIAATQVITYWHKYTEGTNIRIKASSAIRNLVSINEKLKNIIGRIKVTSSVKKAEEAKKDLEEIRNLAVMLQLDVENAKEDWGDVVDFREINEYEKQIDKLIQEKESMMREFSQNKLETKKVKEDVIKKIQEKNEEIEKIQREFDDYKNKNNLGMLGDVRTTSSVISPIATAFPVGGIFAPTNKICEECGKAYPGSIDDIIGISKSSVTIGPSRNLCSECQKKLTGNI